VRIGHIGSVEYNITPSDERTVLVHYSDTGGYATHLCH